MLARWNRLSLPCGLQGLSDQFLCKGAAAKFVSKPLWNHRKRIHVDERCIKRVINNLWTFWSQKCWVQNRYVWMWTDKSYRGHGTLIFMLLYGNSYCGWFRPVCVRVRPYSENKDECSSFRVRLINLTTGVQR